MAPVRQTSFLGGELSSLLWGRTDLETFGIGLRTMRNFFPTRHGAAVSRPGTTHVSFANDDVTGPGRLRLIPFVYSDSQSYVLEFTDGLIRFHSNGMTLNVAGTLEHDPATPYTLASPYVSPELADLRFAQVGNVLTLAHPNHTPMELKRISTTNWTLTPVVFAQIAPYFYDINGGPPCLLSAPLPVNVGTVTLTLPYSYTASDATHPAREWNYYVSKVMQHLKTGRIVETLAVKIVSAWDAVQTHAKTSILNSAIVCYPDRPVTIIRGPNDSSPPVPSYWADYKQIAENIYKGRGKLSGLIGQTDTGRFVDGGIEPDYTSQPLRGDNPFLYTDALGVQQPEEHPRAVAFFQQKRVFASTELRPASIFTSASNDYTNFDKHPIAVAGQPLEFELASRKWEQILDLVQANKLIAFTRSSCWAIAGNETSPLDYDSIDARVIEEIGSLNLHPLLVDGTIFYARGKGQGVRGLVPAGTPSGYAGVDSSTVSSHLFVGATPPVRYSNVSGPAAPFALRKLRDWAYAQDPWGMIWAAREDGALLSFTPRVDELGRNNGSGAWARHDTDGFVGAVCAVPENDEDAIYIAVSRGGALSSRVERLASRVRKGNGTDDCCVDAALTYLGAPPTTIGGLLHLKGKSVWVVGVGNAPQGPLVVSQLGVVTLPQLPVNNSTFVWVNGVLTPTQVTLYVGLAFTADLETLDLAQDAVRGKMKNVTRVGFEVDNARGLFGGQDFDHLDEWEQRAVSDSYSPTGDASVFIQMPVSGSWNLTGRAVLRQTLPLPVTVTAFLREVDVGG